MHGVFTNLLDNAIQHTEADGLVRVTVSESDAAGNGDEAGRLRIEVSDTGAGIAPEHMGRVFEPFFTRARGTGLGLAITRKTVHDHGGEIAVKSEPGKGTSFSFRGAGCYSLLWTRVQYRARKRSPAASANWLRRLSMNSEDKILIVDDQPSVRFGLRSLLEAEGYRALEAEPGEQAISLITEQSPQLVLLLDLKLPDADGLTLLPRIKAIDDEAPVVILTAHGTIETAIQALKAGAENFLTKPFDPDSC